MANTINVTLLKKQITPIGESRFAKIGKRVDEYEGKRRYVINVTFGKGSPAEKKMKAACDKAFELAKADDAFKGKKWNPMCQKGYEELEDGTLSFRFRTNAEFTDYNTGEKITKKIPLFDKHGNKYNSAEIEIGNGSKVQVSYDVGAYYSSSTVHGINLYLHGVMIHDLVEYNGDDCGFTFEEPSAEEVFNGTDNDNAKDNENGKGSSNGSADTSNDFVDPFAEPNEEAPF